MTTDVQFGARFPDMSVTTFVANQSNLSDYTPTPSPLNTGMMADIGRATIYGPDRQENFFAKFMKSPLTRGDSALTARFGEVKSRAFNPLAPDTALFDGQRPEMISNIATKNLSRQVVVEVNDYMLNQFCQTEEMIGDAMSSIMASSNVCYMDDMWVASKEYFTGSLRGAKDSQIHVMTNGIGDTGFGDELNELLWRISQKEFGYKSTNFNASGVNTKASSVAIALDKGVEYRAFNKLLADTFNPDLLRIAVDGGIDYVDSFATPAGKPSGAGELIGMVADVRAFDITPMPDTLAVESFRNPARRSTAYFTTYEYAFQHSPFFDVSYIFAKE